METEIKKSEKALLKELSYICAYCGIALRSEDKTIDHIHPKCANGILEMNNMVVCCEHCNLNKSKLDIKTFLNESERAKCFENYLNHIDYQLGSNEYSQEIKKKTGSSFYSCEYKNNKHKRLKEDVTAFYLLNNGQTVAVNRTQEKILDYYLANPDENDYKKIAHELRLSRSEFKYHVSTINNLTGLLPQKEVSVNGIKLSHYFKNIEKI